MSMEQYFLTFLVTKTSSKKFRKKMFLHFDSFTWSLTLNLGSLLLICLSKSIHGISLTSTGFILMVLWYVLLNMSSNLSIYTFLILKILVFKILIILSATRDFPSLCVECISILLSCNQEFILSIAKLTDFIYPYFVWSMSRFI